MKRFCQYFFKLFSVKSSLVFFYLLTASQTQAEIVQDATLPNPSIVTPDSNTIVITGGTQAGSNLLHSFQEFSVPSNTSASFRQIGLEITNIIARVTGSKISDINGVIEALGVNGKVISADFFLINPNGIIFGPNASLNIGGSFVATTADSIKFADGSQFSAVKPQTASLLKVNVPIGLQFGQTPGEISNASLAPLIDPSTGNPIIDRRSGQPIFGGLQVLPGKTLALVGGSITFPAGAVTLQGGRIELGSVEGTGFVSLTPIANGWILGYEGVQNFQDIWFSQSASLDVSGPGGGSIQVQGGQVTLTGRSGIASATRGNENGGEIRIDASQLKIDNSSRVVSLTSSSKKAPDIIIKTNQLIVENNANITSRTVAAGQTGKLTVSATDYVKVSGGEIVRGKWFPSGLFTEVAAQAIGDGGNLTITTSNLKILDGAQITASTFGAGNAGSMVIQASQVEIGGSAFTPDGRQYRGDRGLPFSSGLYTSVQPGSSGNGGDLTLRADRITLRNGGVLQTATLGKGDAGNLMVKASDFIEVIGTDAEKLFPSALFAASGGITGVTAGVPEATGKGGDINIETRALRVRDGAAIAVGSINPNGDAKGTGNLNIQAETISLDGGRLVAETASGTGGDIDLEVNDLLILRRGSQISTSAGTAQQGGNGGDININAKDGFIVAVPGENSDITANAYSGNRGKINITAAGIYGMVQRSRQDLVRLLKPKNDSEINPNSLSTNDITAISQTNPNLNGDTSVNTPDTEPLELVPLPVNLVDASQQVATGCTPGNRRTRSSFTTIGRGGVAPSPTEPLTEETTIANWIALDPTRGTPLSSTESLQTSNNRHNSFLKNPDSHKIIEAQGWIVDKNGDIVLVAPSPSDNASVPLSLLCHAP